MWLRLAFGYDMASRPSGNRKASGSTTTWPPFLRRMHTEGAGPRSVRLPERLAPVVLADGAIVPPKAATIAPRRGGVIRSACPTLGPG